MEPEQDRGGRDRGGTHARGSEDAVLSVRPRIQRRGFDQRSHCYPGCVLWLRGTLDREAGDLVDRVPPCGGPGAEVECTSS